jgi:protein TonB
MSGVISFVFSNPGHHAEIMLPVVRTLQARGQPCRVVSIAEFRGMTTPKWEVNGAEVHRLMPVRRPIDPPRPAVDQKPRAIYQASPMYPSEMRGKKIEGVVTVLFVVDASGKVTNLRVEKSSAVTFEKPAMEAVRRWKFEPAIKGGQRVACKMRVPIRFQPN